MNRKTIALLVSNINHTFSNSITLGAMAAAEELDVNLVIVPGRYLNFNYSDMCENKYEYQFNSLFSYIRDNNVDSIACAVSTIAYMCEPSAKKLFMEAFSPESTITIAEKIDGYPCVKFNNATGIHEAVDFLLNERHRKRIGMFSGFLSNQDSKERLDAYISALSKNGIEVDTGLIAYADLSMVCRKEADAYLDANPDVDAIICTNDAMALTMCDAIKDKGLKVGEDIAVVGFDNIPEAIKYDPALTTVYADSERLGYEAIVGALALADRKDIGDLLVPTQLITRSSTGTMPSEVERIFAAIDKNMSDEESAAREIMAALFPSHSYEKPDYSAAKQCLSELIGYVYRSLAVDRPADGATVGFVDKCRELASHKYESFFGLEKLRWLIDSCIDWLKLRYPQNCDIYKYAHYLFYSDTCDTIDDNRGLCAKDEEGTKWRHNYVLRNMLMFDATELVDSMYSEILKTINFFLIEHSQLFIFESHIEYYNSGLFFPPQKLLLKAVQESMTTTCIPADEQSVALCDLFSNKYLPKGRFTVLLTPVFSNETQYGLYVMSLHPSAFCDLDMITYLLNASIKMTDLIKSQNEHIMLLSENNMMLDNISKIDALTGLLNRRGFNRMSKDAYKSGIIAGQKCLIAFCDMDNLKLINDRYGHHEGDFAIKGIASILKRTFRSSDVVGRVGGDEYVAVALTDNENLRDIVKERMDKCIDEFNAASGKPYKLAMSVGFNMVDCSEDISLEDAIDVADEALYVEKKKRKKSI